MNEASYANESVQLTVGVALERPGTASLLKEEGGCVSEVTQPSPGSSARLSGQ